ncbi:hypothetical protein KIN20_014344 [Parelaphostrongylus tenuis]|uniref:Uncharacterized protein n=1 Tax=Parelaphostrongylus tenuis TaxID=148309 RepID=A0AAD5MI87_PARTN|nr:hypothetical protein KIN20_014344 [Parelaphostrongylus tenuis]
MNEFSLRDGVIDKDNCVKTNAFAILWEEQSGMTSDDLLRGSDLASCAVLTA